MIVHWALLAIEDDDCPLGLYGRAFRSLLIDCEGRIFLLWTSDAIFTTKAIKLEGMEGEPLYLAYIPKREKRCT